MNYIASDQDIDAGEIAPAIIAVADLASTQQETAVTVDVLQNDSYLTSSPITITLGNPSNGVTALSGSSPEQIIYTPDNNFYGTDTFTANNYSR